MTISTMGDISHEESNIQPNNLTNYSPIYIAGDSDFHTQATSEGWDLGGARDGSEGSPYVISGYLIDAPGEYCIRIFSVSSVHYVVENNRIQNCEVGIELNTVTTGIFRDLEVTYSNFTGIKATYTSGLLFDNITVSNTEKHYSTEDSGTGLYLNQDSNNNQIINSNFVNNNHHGVLIATSVSNEFLQNKIDSNGENGITVATNSNYTQIVQNEISDNGYDGIATPYDYASYYLDIDDNTITGNLHSGIWITSYNNITNNYFFNNDRATFVQSNNSIINNYYSNNRDQLSVQKYNNITNNEFHHGEFGIYLNEGNLIKQNYLYNHSFAIRSVTTIKEGNVVVENQIDLAEKAIYIRGSYHKIIGNIISNAAIGINEVVQSEIKDNSMINSGLFLRSEYSFTTNKFDNNTVNNEQIQFYINQNDISIPGTQSQIIIINSSNIVIDGVQLIFSTTSISIYNSNNIKVSNSIFDTYNGIVAIDVENLELNNNEFNIHGGMGIFVEKSSTRTKFLPDINILDNTFDNFRTYESPLLYSNIAVYAFYLNASTIINNQVRGFSVGISITNGWNMEISKNDIDAYLGVSVEGGSQKYQNVNIIVNNINALTTLNLQRGNNTLISSNIFSGYKTNASMLNYGLYAVDLSNFEVVGNNFLSPNADHVYRENSVGIYLENYWEEVSGDYVFGNSRELDLDPKSDPYLINKPILSINSQTPSGPYSEVLTLGWIGTNTNYEVVYSIYYSIDNGGTWNPLVLNYNNTTYEWSTFGFENSTEYKMKIVAKGPHYWESTYVTNTVTISNVAHNYLAPNFTEDLSSKTLSGIYEITWKPAKDQWHSSLVYSLYFSDDGGVSWFELITNTKYTYFTWNTSKHDTGDNYLLKLVVSDGFDTLEVISDIFTIENVNLNDPNRVTITETVTGDAGGESDSGFIFYNSAIMIPIFAVLSIIRRKFYKSN